MKRFLALLALLAACQADPPTVPESVKAAEARATADSLRAAQLDSVAAHYYAAGRAAQDSATFYHQQSTHVQALTTGSDSAALARFFADYAQPVRAR